MPSKEKENFIETTHLMDKVFDSSIKVAETENVFMEYLNNAEEQYRSETKRDYIRAHY